MQFSPCNRNILPQEMPEDINVSTHFKDIRQKKNNVSNFHVIDGTDIEVSPKINHMTLKKNLTPSQNYSDISV